MRTFDESYWDNHWADATASTSPASSNHSEHHPHHTLPVNPYLREAVSTMPVGSVLDAGSGAGTDALWLAEHGWEVTAADISTSAITAARSRASEQSPEVESSIEWVRADLTTWEPGRTWGLVVTHYAHPDDGQLAFYERLASWVAPGGTIVIVGHLHGRDATHHHPEGSTATLAGITGLFDRPGWRVEAARENTRIVQTGGGRVELRDVVVRACRTC